MQPGEQPIKIYIYPFFSESYKGSHAAMSYGDLTIDFGPQGFKNHNTQDDRYAHDCDIYYVYPSDVGINPDKLEEAMRKRQRKVKARDYDYISQNCADQVIACLEEAGAKDIPSTLGISIPQMAIFNSLDDWCETHGTLMENRLSLKDYNKNTLDIMHSLRMLTNKNEFISESKKMYQTSHQKAKNSEQKRQAFDNYIDKAKFFERTPDELATYIIIKFQECKNDKYFKQNMGKLLDKYWDKIPQKQKEMLIVNNISPQRLNKKTIDTAKPTKYPTIINMRDRGQNQRA